MKFKKALYITINGNSISLYIVTTKKSYLQIHLMSSQEMTFWMKRSLKTSFLRKSNLTLLTIPRCLKKKVVFSLRSHRTGNSVHGRHNLNIYLVTSKCYLLLGLSTGVVSTGPSTNFYSYNTTIIIQVCQIKDISRWRILE